MEYEQVLLCISFYSQGGHLARPKDILELRDVASWCLGTYAYWIGEQT